MQHQLDAKGQQDEPKNLLEHLQNRLCEVLRNVCGEQHQPQVNEQNRYQMWIPRGFAHGFIVRSESADFFYKCDEVYSPADEIVLRWNDPQLGIDWGCDDPKVSARDREGLALAQLAGRLPRYETA